jgi:hypothetical protein
MPAVSVTESYDALLTTTARKYLPKKVVDMLSQGRYLRFLMKGSKSRPKGTTGDLPSGYDLIGTGLGEKIEIPLMYGGAPVDTYSGWNTISTTPIDGVTAAFADWRQVASTVVINGMEEAKNSGEERIISLLQTKLDQAAITIKDFVNKIIVSGNADNGSCLVPYVSSANASSGPDPLCKLVSKTPTTGTVQSIDTSANTWFANQFTQSGAATWAAFFKELDTLFANVALAAGGDDEPDFHLTDSETFQMYRAALRQYAKVEGFVDAELPFENVGFRGCPAFYDKWTPDSLTGTTPGLGGASTTRAKGTWFMLCSPYLRIVASSANNFKVGNFIEPVDQDGKAAKVLWYGAHVVSNRAKQGLLNNIDPTLAS